MCATYTSQGPVAALRWVLSRRAYTARNLAGYARMGLIRARYPSVSFQGPVFIGPDVKFEVRRGYGRIIVGPWCHFGEGVRVRCHEGTLRIGAKTVLASRVTVNTWLDIDIGQACLLGEDVYVCDFDHRMEDLNRPIKDQGLIKSPVHIGDDVWLGTKSTVTRGTRMGPGSVLAANSVAKGTYPPDAVAAGSPARVVRFRDPTVDLRRRLAEGREPRLRPEARALIRDPDGRILLCRLDGASADPPGRPWACPGGVPLPNESTESALHRLVREQTGLTVLFPDVTPGGTPLPDPVWVDDIMIALDRWDGRRVSYFEVPVAGGRPLGESWSSRAVRHQDPRWFDPAQRTPAAISPQWLFTRLTDPAATKGAVDGSVPGRLKHDSV